MSTIYDQGPIRYMEGGTRVTQERIKKKKRKNFKYLKIRV